MRMILHKYFVSFGIVLLGLGARAQVQLDTLIPTDPQVKIGHLDNGIHSGR